MDPQLETFKIYIQQKITCLVVMLPPQVKQEGIFNIANIRFFSAGAI